MAAMRRWQTNGATNLGRVVRRAVEAGDAVAAAVDGAPVVLVLVKDAHHSSRRKPVHECLQVVQEGGVVHARCDLHLVPNKPQLQQRAPVMP